MQFLEGDRRMGLRVKRYVLLARVSLLVLLGLLVWLGCLWVNHLWEEDRAAGDAYVRSLATTHPAQWRVSGEEWGRRVAALQDVKLGDRREDVIARVGPPEKDVAGFSESVPPKMMGWTVMYRFLRYENGLENMKWDQSVHLFFGTDGRLRSVRSNVEGVRNAR
jgi:hypothetical protein